ncbi:uncharacterized protein LOC124154130 [Ischnura elegans]|uniref:uncharacterized protein LOC124154130 n=1 Tax=Ischnura elegans TaxID=197161 RepID=UPI001ED89A20|nr:uncharacterized protein LOC124154130 [Ischnura elegans]
MRTFLLVLSAVLVVGASAQSWIPFLGDGPLGSLLSFAPGQVMPPFLGSMNRRAPNQGFNRGGQNFPFLGDGPLGSLLSFTPEQVMPPFLGSMNRRAPNQGFNRGGQSFGHSEYHQNQPSSILDHPTRLLSSIRTRRSTQPVAPAHQGGLQQSTGDSGNLDGHIVVL